MKLIALNIHPIQKYRAGVAKSKDYNYDIQKNYTGRFYLVAIVEDDEGARRTVSLELEQGMDIESAGLVDWVLEIGGCVSQ